MKFIQSTTALLSLLFATTFSSSLVSAQVPKTSELHQTFLAKDSTLFTVGFNKCNLSVLSDMVADDLEFYHDITGLENKTQFMNSIKNNICESKEREIRRKLVQDSLEVFPLKKNNQIFAVVQRGIHEFYVRPVGSSQEFEKSGQAKFSNLWRLDDGVWKLARVYSFAHEGN